MEQQIKKPFWKKWWVWVIAVLVLFYFIGSADSPNNSSNGSAETASTPVQEEPAIKVSATQLVSDYEANEVSADAKYKSKIVEVSGTIENIAKDILDTPYVSLNGNSQNLFTDVQCMFDKSDQAELASLAKDKKITLRGKVSGKLGNVLLNDCQIVK